jgi:hypothetical protein
MKLTTQRVAYYALPKALGFLRALELQALRESAGRIPRSAPPVFIVGSPRTGSTLFYQLLTQRFRVGYVSNLAALFFKSLSVGIRLHQHIFGDRPHNSFTSYYGRTAGWAAPSECGKFWYQWFPDDRHFVSADEWRPGRYARLRDTLAVISQTLRTPFVFKNLTCGQRLQVLPRIFPEARYLFIVRDPLHTAESILARRQRNGGDKQQWSSVRPSNFQDLAELPYPVQVAAQVYWTGRQIREDLSRLPADRSLTIRYEDLCSDVTGELDRVASFLRSAGASLAERDQPWMPPVRIQHSSAVSREDHVALTAEVARFDWSHLSP